MINIDIVKPNIDELEITTIGPGSKDGECIVVHVNGQWYIIDSCKYNGVPVALIYLEKIGVLPEQVSIVFCSHWHLDHIRGLDVLLKKCVHAEFYVPCVGGKKSNVSHILQLAESQSFDSRVWKIYKACIDVLSEREIKTKPQLLTHDQTLLRLPDGSIEIHALGASDEMMCNFETALLRLDPNNPSATQFEDLEENLCSAALAIKFHGINCLIGGDVEVARKEKYNFQSCNDGCSAHDECGWCDIKFKSKLYPIDKPFSIVKIPHHSSASAYCPQMWPFDFVQNPISTTTLFNCSKGEDLPTKEMLTLYYSHTNELYMTGDGRKAIAPVQRPEVEEINEDNNIQLLETPVEGLGIVVCRLKAGSNIWQVWKYGTALKVDEQFINEYHSK